VREPVARLEVVRRGSFKIVGLNAGGRVATAGTAGEGVPGVGAVPIDEHSIERAAVAGRRSAHARQNERAGGDICSRRNRRRSRTDQAVEAQQRLGFVVVAVGVIDETLGAQIAAGVGRRLAEFRIDRAGVAVDALLQMSDADRTRGQILNAEERPVERIGGFRRPKRPAIGAAVPGQDRPAVVRFAVGPGLQNRP